MATKTIAIIGAGLAGSAAAFFLAEAGMKVTIFEQGNMVACGASGNEYGVIYPRIELKENKATIFYKNSFDFLLDFLENLSEEEKEEIGFHQSGLVIVPSSTERSAKFVTLHNESSIGGYDIDIVTGEDLPYSSLLLKSGAYLSPLKLCNFFCNHKNITLHLNSKIDDLSLLIKDFDIVIAANSFALTKFTETKNFAIEKIKGQVTKMPSALLDGREMPTRILCKDCYLIPETDGYFHFGASFEKNLEIAEVTEQAHRQNLEKLSLTLPRIDLSQIDIGKLQGRSSFRAYAGDKLPIIGSFDNFYITACHGSRGLLSAIYGGSLLKDLLTGQLGELQAKDLETVSPGRISL